MNVQDMIPTIFQPFDPSTCGSRLYSIDTSPDGTYLSIYSCANDGTLKLNETNKLNTLEGIYGQLSALSFHPYSGYLTAMCEYSQNLVVIDRETNVSYLPYPHNDISLDGGDIYIDIEGNVAFLRVSTAPDYSFSIQKTNLNMNGKFPFKIIELSVDLSELLKMNGYTKHNIKASGIVVSTSGRFFIAGWAIPQNAKDPIYNVIMEAQLSNTDFTINKIVPLVSVEEGYIVSGISEVFQCIGPQLILSWSSVQSSAYILTTLTESEFDITPNLNYKKTVVAYKNDAANGVSLDIASCKYASYKSKENVVGGMAVGPSHYEESALEDEPEPGFMVNYGLPFMEMVSSILTNLAG